MQNTSKLNVNCSTNKEIDLKDNLHIECIFCPNYLQSNSQDSMKPNWDLWNAPFQKNVGLIGNSSMDNVDFIKITYPLFLVSNFSMEILVDFGKMIWISKIHSNMKKKGEEVGLSNK